MSVENTRKVVESYLNASHGVTRTLADDVVFTLMGTGQEERGPEAVLNMLKYLYRVAFDARAETMNLIVGDGQAALEATFIGKHIGEFAGVPATNKDVRVPLVVIYDVENDQIKRGRAYMDMAVLFGQLGVMPGATAGGTG